MRLFILSVFVTLAFSACKKKAEKADVAVYVKHHGVLISGATVYVKYNAEEFPGTDPSLYDESKVCGTTGHGIGHAHFEGLDAGNHYFYSVGYDSTIMDDVMGCIGLKIEESSVKQDLDLDIPVTE